jgi:catechol 2,3-dioxygenase-like lactoylglutathione lyase family enzyme
MKQRGTMHRLLIAVLLTVFVAATPTRASAQLAAAKEGPIVYGHHHLNTSNVEAQKKFFVDTLGGTAVKIGANQQEIVKFPNVLIFFRANQAPTGGTKGTTVNHIGFSVPNLRPVVDKIKANGYQMITKSEVPPTDEVKDDIAIRGNTRLAFALGPDDVKVEFVQAADQTMPIRLHHVHFFNPQNTEMRDWYAKMFGAKPRETPNFAAADLPGVALNFTKSPDPVVGTQGRALDHIGFEVKNLEEVMKKMESTGVKIERPYTKVAALNIAIAFIKDPWGTYIELTEGLDKIP